MKGLAECEGRRRPRLTRRSSVAGLTSTASAASTRVSASFGASILLRKASQVPSAAYSTTAQTRDFRALIADRATPSHLSSLQCDVRESDRTVPIQQSHGKAPICRQAHWTTQSGESGNVIPPHSANNIRGCLELFDPHRNRIEPFVLQRIRPTSSVIHWRLITFAGGDDDPFASKIIRCAIAAECSLRR